MTKLRFKKPVFAKRRTEVPADPNDNPSRYPRVWFRFFEMLPGLAVWTSLLLPLILARFLPVYVTGFVILFDVYWLIKSFAFSVNLYRGQKRFREMVKIDWLQKLKNLDALPADELAARDIFPWRDITHAVIIAMYKEDASIVRENIRSVVESAYPNDRIVIILATEGRAGEPAQAVARELKEEFGDKVSRFLISTHPDGILGEVKAKGANVNWAARQFAKICAREGLDTEKILVSTADADSRFHSQYFARLSYAFLTAEKRLQACYQPTSLYFNNVWETSIPSRVTAFNTTYWTLTESLNNYRLVTFATHACSLATLESINFWSTSIVNEDSRQFYRSWFHFGGRFRTVPLWVPVYMDAVQVGDWKETFRNLYLQQQRWAYGIEHFPYIVLESWRRRDIPLGWRFMLCFRTFAGAYTWSTATVYLSIVGWLPILLSDSFQQHVASTFFPQLASSFLRVTWLGLLLSGLVTMALLRTTFGKSDRRKELPMFLQWIVVPVTGVIFTAIPGWHAQTRLMFGKYLGFRVTEKATVTEKPA